MLNKILKSNNFTIRPQNIYSKPCLNLLKRKKKIEKKIIKRIEKLFKTKQLEDGRSFGTYKYQRKVY